MGTQQKFLKCVLGDNKHINSKNNKQTCTQTHAGSVTYCM